VSLIDETSRGLLMYCGIVAEEAAIEEVLGYEEYCW
jgi:hypothetical protein